MIEGVEEESRGGLEFGVDIDPYGGLSFEGVALGKNREFGYDPCVGGLGVKGFPGEMAGSADERSNGLECSSSPPVCLL